MEPSWELLFPSPLRVSNLTQEMNTVVGNNIANKCPNTPGRLMISSSDSHFSIVDPVTPTSTNIGQKRPLTPAEAAAISLSSEQLAELITYTPNEVRASQHIDFPRVFLSARSCSAADINELERYVFATIEKDRESYICMHDVTDHVAKKLGPSNNHVKWRKFNDHSFLFALPDKNVREKFLQSNKVMCIGDAVVTYKPWKPVVSNVKKPCRFKVWLRLTGLPIEYMNFSAAERAVSSFGSLFKCNMQKKESYVGCFYVMVECADIDDIKSRVLVQTDNDCEIPVFVDKLYVCEIDVYNARKFPDDATYDDILGRLMDCGKLIPL